MADGVGVPDSEGRRTSPARSSPSLSCRDARASARSASPEVEARRRRVETAALGFTGEAAAAHAALADDDARVRVAALHALSRLGALESTEVDRLIADRSPMVRRAVAELAPRLPGGDFAPLLDDAEHEVVEAGCFALGELGDPRPLLRLLEIAAGHEDALCREAAVAALGAIGDPVALPTLIAALEDRPEIRRRAVVALSPFRGDAVHAALTAALGDRDWQVRQAAEDVLALSEDGED
jgi:HEAT repeat protein